jgi:glycosyltransferase involved in cell wall biosynthesis
MKTPKVQIFIMSRNRPSYLLEALESCLSQTYCDVQVIVSDNSDHDEVRLLLQDRYPSVLCRARRPVLSAIDHFNQIISEVEAPFFVVFHDDDVLMPDYVSSVLNVFESHPEASAIACDAHILFGQEKTKKRMAGVMDEMIRIKSPIDFLRYYFSFSRVRPAPFPSYMYRKAALAQVVLNRASGGKYSDVAWLLEVLHRGTVFWLPQPLLWYRIHGSNDSATESIGQRMSLLRFVFRRGFIKRHDRLVTDYRFKYWFSWYRQDKSKKRFPWRAGIVRTFLLCQGLRLLLTRPSFWARALGRLK